jgi:hypothetical protein
MPEETALTKQEPKPEIVKAQSAKQTRLAAFTPANLTEAIALAKMMAQSDVVPKDYKGKAANILVAIQFGSEIGLAPMQSLQSIAVINGRPSLWGDGALALVQGHPDFEDIQETTTGTIATCVIKRRGRTPVIRTFSDDDAQKAALLAKGGPWTQYRARMRQMRARGFALRDSFADVLKGISIAEEAMDIPIDTSSVKQQRESMTLDVSALTASSEPNRGHNDTGLQRSESQEMKKQEDVMCGHCGKINGHEESCPEFARAQQDAKTSKPTTRAAFMILEVTQKKKKDGGPYFLLEVVDPQDHQGKLYVWHKSLFEYLIKAKGQSMMCEISEQNADNKTFHQLEHIIELAGVSFVDNKPALKGEMPAQTEEEF